MIGWYLGLVVVIVIASHFIPVKPDQTDEDRFQMMLTGAAVACLLGFGFLVVMAHDLLGKGG